MPLVMYVCNEFWSVVRIKSMKTNDLKSVQRILYFYIQNGRGRPKTKQTPWILTKNDANKRYMTPNIKTCRQSKFPTRFKHLTCRQSRFPKRFNNLTCRLSRFPKHFEHLTCRQSRFPQPLKMWLVASHDSRTLKTFGLSSVRVSETLKTFDLLSVTIS